MNISETSRRITIKLYVKHYWGDGKGASDFWLEGIKTLVSMATDSSHRHYSVFSAVFDRIPFILEVMYMIVHKILDDFKIRSDLTNYYGVSCP